MHDDIMGTLTNMRHVPNLRRNLIFLCMLDSGKYKTSERWGFEISPRFSGGDDG